MTLRIGTAGWSIPRSVAEAFPSHGSALSRYADQFSATEINSSFHRPHRRSTWERWRDSVPATFRFSAKLPKTITHERKLLDCTPDIEDFLQQVSVLGDKLAALLVQLPPKLQFDRGVAHSFFQSLVCRTEVNIVCEPRHPSWFAHDADSLLKELKISRVAADPAVCATAAEPAGWAGLSYWRLHGSPVMYRSSYDDRMEAYAARLKREIAMTRRVWCIFDKPPHRQVPPMHSRSVKQWQVRTAEVRVVAGYITSTRRCRRTRGVRKRYCVSWSERRALRYCAKRQNPWAQKTLSAHRFRRNMAAFSGA